MLLEHDRNYDLGMDALVTVCSWNTNGIMIWARPAPGHMRSRSLERSARPLKVGRAQPCHGCVLLFAQLQRRAKSAEGPCEFDPPRQECTGKTSTGNTFACAAQRLGGGLNPKP